MHKLWPPAYDDFSVRLWAMVASAVVNSVLWAFALSKSDTALLLLMFPGVFPEVLISGRGIEEGITWAGLVAWVATECGFYYLVAWWLIRAFQRTEGWWPTKTS